MGNTCRLAVGRPRIKHNFSLVENRLSLTGLLDLGWDLCFGVFFAEMFPPGRFILLVSLKKDEWWCPYGKFTVAVLLEGWCQETMCCLRGDIACEQAL